MSLSALIFDVDGTMAETDDVHRAAYNEAFAEFGLGWNWSPPIYSRLLGLDDGPGRLFAHASEFQPGFLSLPGNRDMLGKVFERKTEHYARLLGEGAAPLRAGVTRLIGEARSDGVAIAAVSFGSRAEFEQVLVSQLGPEILDCFSVTVTGDDLTPGDSPAKAYGAAISRLGIAPEHIIAVDDSARGVRGAARHGLGVVATPGIYRSSEQFDEAWIVLSDLGRPAEPFKLLRGPELPHDFITIEALEALRRCVACNA